MQVAEEPPKKIRAAQYVRMSTEHQQYSTANQDDIIQEYADQRNYEIVKTYADEGKSGLSVAGRRSIQKLIEDVQNGSADFEVILVYDVVDGGVFKTPMKVRTTNICANEPAYPFIIAQNNSKTTVDQLRPSSKASSEPWPANTVANFQPKCSKDNAA